MGRQKTSNDSWLSVALITIFAVLIFFAPSYGWAVRNFLSPPAAMQAAATTTLAEENDALAAQLAELSVIRAQLPTSTPNEIRAMVYSRYPMNFKNEILVDAGSDEGVTPGAAVVFQGMLLGQVKQVFPGSAVVQTIFDNGLKIPVRIGDGGYDGLLAGGSEPMVGSIAAVSPVRENDIVYSAAPGLPYALPVATVTATSTSADSLFEQAAINIPYDVNNIETVFIVK